MQRIERIRQFAELSVRRACAFAALAIATLMIGLSADPLVALKTGAISSTLLWVILFIKSLRSGQTDYRKTELWILLDRRHDLPEAQAPRVIGGVLRDVYLRHAELAAWAAFLFWVLVLAAWLFGA
ncbi:MAG TPA: hypothetical protein VED46_05490 [Alphaproteobacteria bacterium]|nr:hypothetical protein [Alphaproteobacteria bacterium]